MKPCTAVSHIWQLCTTSTGNTAKRLFITLALSWGNFPSCYLAVQLAWGPKKKERTDVWVVPGYHHRMKVCRISPTPLRLKALVEIVGGWERRRKSWHGWEYWGQGLVPGKGWNLLNSLPLALPRWHLHLTPSLWLLPTTHREKHDIFQKKRRTTGGAVFKWGITKYWMLNARPGFVLLLFGYLCSSSWQISPLAQI